MPYPDYVLTRQVSVGGARGLESSTPIKIEVTVTASRSLVWADNGTRFEKIGVQMTSEPGSEVVFPLPRTDVPGWRDGQTGAVLDVSAEGAYSHRYIATIRYLDEQGRSLPTPTTSIGPFVLPAGDGSTVDLDKTVPTSTVAGDAVSVPDSWGTDIAAARQAAEDAAAALAAIGVATVAATPDSVPRRTASGALAVATATAPEHAVPLGVARTTFAGAHLVDVTRFLAPGAALPNDGSANAAPLIQAAVDWVAANAATLGPQQVYLPAGRYRLESGLQWRTKVGLVGAGEQETVLLPIGRVCAINRWDVVGAWDGSTRVQDAVFADFTIDCAGQTHTEYDFQMKGIFIQHMDRCRFERVTILGSWATAFGVDFLDDVRFVNCTSRGSGRGGPATPYATGAGFGIGTGEKPVERVTLTDCVATGAASSGFFFEQLSGRAEGIYKPAGISMTNCIASGNNQGVLDTGCDGLRAVNCTLVSNTLAGWVAGAYGQSESSGQGGRNGLIDSCTITDNGNGGGIYLTHTISGGYTIRGCDLRRNAGGAVFMVDGAAMTGSLRIERNLIERNGGAGVDIRNTGTLTDLTIVGNTIRDNGTNASKTYRAGVSIGAALTDPRINDNVVRRTSGQSTQPTGIALLGATKTTTRPRVAGNTVLGHSVAQITVEHTVGDASRITDNVVA